jgi:hypothetical protein
VLSYLIRNKLFGDYLVPTQSADVERDLFVVNGRLGLNCSRTNPSALHRVLRLKENSPSARIDSEEKIEYASIGEGEGKG